MGGQLDVVNSIFYSLNRGKRFAASPVKAREDVFDDPTVKHLGLISESEGGDGLGRVVQPAPMARSRGKVMFALINPGQPRDDHVADAPSLEGRVFANSCPGEPDAAFFNSDDLIANQDEIVALVEAGYVVRIRADADTVEARTGDLAWRLHSIVVLSGSAPSLRRSWTWAWASRAPNSAFPVVM